MSKNRRSWPMEPKAKIYAIIDIDIIRVFKMDASA